YESTEIAHLEHRTERREVDASIDDEEREEHSDQWVKGECRRCQRDDGDDHVEGRPPNLPGGARLGGRLYLWCNDCHVKPRIFAFIPTSVGLSQNSILLLIA